MTSQGANKHGYPAAPIFHLPLARVPQDARDGTPIHRHSKLNCSSTKIMPTRVVLGCRGLSIDVSGSFRTPLVMSSFESRSGGGAIPPPHQVHTRACFLIQLHVYSTRHRSRTSYLGRRTFRILSMGSFRIVYGVTPRRLCVGFLTEHLFVMAKLLDYG